MKLRAAVLVIALTALAGPNAWAATTSRKIIIFKEPATLEQAHELLGRLKARPLGQVIHSNDRAEKKEFVAVVADVPSGAGTPAEGARLADASWPSAGLGETGLSEESVIMEDDFRIKWIESSPSLLQATPFPAAASLSGLGLGKFSRSQSAARLGISEAELPRAIARLAAADVGAAAEAELGERRWNIRRVNAPTAWDYGVEGAGVNVAVIDTGIFSRHGDLLGKVRRGYNAIMDCDKESCWQDDNGHGTHVAGTIAAREDGIGVVGVAPKAGLVAVKVLDADGSGTLSDVIKGIVWVANNADPDDNPYRIRVANMSLGSPIPSEAMHRAVRYLKARGVVVVAAAGNSGGAVGYPAAYPEVIAVSASKRVPRREPNGKKIWVDELAEFTSRGPQVAFIAPGSEVLSTWKNGSWLPLRGTSMASPHVAGLAALAVSLGYIGTDGEEGVREALSRAAVKVKVYRTKVEGDKAVESLVPLADSEQGEGMIDAGILVTRRPGLSLAVAP